MYDNETAILILIRGIIVKCFFEICPLHCVSLAGITDSPDTRKSEIFSARHGLFFVSLSIARPGFEPGAAAPKAAMFDHSKTEGFVRGEKLPREF